MKIFALSSGSYSDYKVNALFRNEDDAKAVIATQDYGFEIEEYDLFEETPKRRMLYHITASRRNNGLRWTSEIEGGWRLAEWDRLVWPWDCSHPKNLRAKITYKAPSNYGYDNLWFTVEGWDGEACRKVVYDTITKLKAIHEGVADQ